MKQCKRLAAILLSLFLIFGELILPISTLPTLSFASTANAETLQMVARSKKKKATLTPVVTETPAPTLDPEATPEGPIIEPQAIADFLFTFGYLPDNFLTKKEARNLGWDSSYNYVSDVAPGMSIGGDRFGNYEELLPVVKGRQYYEADCYYTSGRRNAYRIIFSSDAHVYYTDDHYQTFTELFPSDGIDPVGTMTPKESNTTRAP